MVEIRKEKKAGSPLPVYIAHMYPKYQVLGEQEQNDYNDAVKLLEYGGPETELEDEVADLDPSPSKEPRKRVRTEETPTAPEVATTPPRAPERTQTPREVQEASGSGN